MDKIDWTKFDQYHSTYKEKQFIKNIGTYSISNRVKEKTKHQLLKHYILAAKNRDNWDNVDQAECIDYAEKLLAESNSNSAFLIRRK